jgi:probable HAF family extracellular repeat protein
MEDLGTLGGEMSIATAINDEGQVVGYSQAYGTVVAFLWTRENGMVALSWPEGAEAWVATDINNKGVVAGVSVMSGDGDPQRGILWVLK